MICWSNPGTHRIANTAVSTHSPSSLRICLATVAACCTRSCGEAHRSSPESCAAHQFRNVGIFVQFLQRGSNAIKIELRDWRIALEPESSHSSSTGAGGRLQPSARKSSISSASALSNSEERIRERIVHGNKDRLQACKRRSSGSPALTLLSVREHEVNVSAASSGHSHGSSSDSDCRSIFSMLIRNHFTLREIFKNKTSQIRLKPTRSYNSIACRLSLTITCSHENNAFIAMRLSQARKQLGGEGLRRDAMDVRTDPLISE